MIEVIMTSTIFRAEIGPTRQSGEAILGRRIIEKNLYTGNITELAICY
jgi:hypothetical protein